MSDFVKYIGFAAGFLTVASFLPQVIKVWRSRQVRDLSLGMYILLVTAGAMWLAYGILSKDWPVILTNSGMVAMNAAILVAKVRFGGQETRAR